MHWKEKVNPVYLNKRLSNMKCIWRRETEVPGKGNKNLTIVIQLHEVGVIIIVNL